MSDFNIKQKIPYSRVTVKPCSSLSDAQDGAAVEPWRGGPLLMQQ